MSELKKHAVVSHQEWLAAREAFLVEEKAHSIFYKDGRGDLFHTYSCYARGIEVVNGAYHFIDLLPKGRDEGIHPQSWVRYHDRYED